jgi:phage-related minor tail protein
MTEKAKEELLKLEEQIINLEKKKYEVGRRLDEIQGEMWLIRARLLLEVAWERDERGKPVYPSHDLREEVVTARLAEHDRYQALRRKEMALSQEQDGLLNELTRLSERKEQLIAE